MSWRTVVISSRCKLDTKMGYMVVRSDEVNRIFLDEIAVVIIENPAVAMTGCLLSELLRRNRPPEGIVQMLTITEKQFAKMEYLTGA